MSFTKNSTGRQVTPGELRETTGAEPPARVYTLPPGTRKGAKRVIRVPFQRAAYTIVVVAAVAVLLALLGVFVPRIMSSVITAFYIGLFAAVVSLMNLTRPAALGNTLLRRRVFPVLRAPDRDIIRLAGVTGTLVFLFTAVFSLLASFIGAFLTGLVLIVSVVAMAYFYGRVRSVVTRP